MPSKILKNIFRHKNVDCVSVVLDDFLVRINSTQVAQPDTPPRHAATSAEELARDVDYLNTPQKNPYGPTMMITPPLTPEGDQFQAAQQKAYMSVPHIQISAPATPTPESYHHGSAYLQPMQHDTPVHYYTANNMIM